MEQRLLTTAAEMVAAHRAGARTPADTVAETYARIRAHADPAIFIHLRPESEVLAEARGLAEGAASALYGVPLAVKDNIDVAGLPTTAACPAFAYRADADATAVRRLREAGALVIGKTNLDQFATGLVGVRSPYGIPRNAYDARLVPGGSSSGSAVAVAAGLVPLALGTDTAGSGRVPAGLNNIVGLKPSLGLVPASGVVPACRTLDCVSIFSLTVDDAVLALSAMSGKDTADPFSRDRAFGPLTAMPHGVRIGVPHAGQRRFFGNAAFAAAYDAAIARAESLGASVSLVDIEPLYETARLLYEGPWVAERYLAVRDLVASDPEALHPVTREIVMQGARPSAADAFSAFYRLAELRRASERIFQSVDLLLLPTIPTAYTVEQVLADPIELNSRLGAYTNFVNLLDLCGLAVPAAIAGDGIPFGVTFLAPGGDDALLASIGRVFHADTALPLGASQTRQPQPAPVAAVPARTIEVAVVGAHLSGMPLNRELQGLDGKLVEETETTADYRLYALPNSDPEKPGLLRVADGEGAPIKLEVWSLSPEGFGRFVASLPPPMTIGTVRLMGGSTVKGFLVEPEALAGATDITRSGGWRAYLAGRPRRVAAES